MPWLSHQTCGSGVYLLGLCQLHLVRFSPSSRHLPSSLTLVHCTISIPSGTLQTTLLEAFGCRLSEIPPKFFCLLFNFLLFRKPHKSGNWRQNAWFVRCISLTLTTPGRLRSPFAESFTTTSHYINFPYPGIFCPTYLFAVFGSIVLQSVSL